jgi:BlaI family transcriptional regulator, penicillinase repressor
VARKQKNPPLTRLELEIMRALWELRSGTVQQVMEHLPRNKLAYTTVQTMLTVLHRKGKVRRVLKGRAHEYVPVVTRARATHAALRDLVQRFFAGSAESLVMTLVKSRDLSPEKLSALAHQVEQDQPPPEKE